MPLLRRSLSAALGVAILGSVISETGSARTERFPVSVTERSFKGVFAAEPQRCITIAYVLFPPVPGAAGYSLAYTDNFGGKPTRAAVGPFTGRGDIADAIPRSANTSLFPLATASPGGGECADGAFAGRFTDAVVTVQVPDDASYLAGAVKDLDGEPVERVPIRLRGPGTSTTATTDGTGQYVKRVRPGRYVAAPAQRRPFRPKRRQVRVPRGATRRANFVLQARESAELTAFARTDREYVLAGETYTVFVEISNTGKKGAQLTGVRFATRGGASVAGAKAGLIPSGLRLGPGERQTVTFQATATPATVRTVVAGTDLDVQAVHNPLSGILVRAIGTSQSDDGPRPVQSPAAYTWVDVGQKGALEAAVAGGGNTLRQWLNTSQDLWGLVQTEDGRQVVSQSARSALARAYQTTFVSSVPELARALDVAPSVARKVKRDFAQLNALLASGNWSELSERAGRAAPAALVETLVFGPAGKAAAPAIKRSFNSVAGPATRGVRRKVNARRKALGLAPVGKKDWRDATSGTKTTPAFERGAGWKKADLDELERRARETGQTFILFPRVAVKDPFWNKGTEIKTKAVDPQKFDTLLGYPRRLAGKVVWQAPKRPKARDLLVMTTKEITQVRARFRDRLADFRGNRDKVAEWRASGRIPLDDLDWRSNGIDPSGLSPELQALSTRGEASFAIDRNNVMQINKLPVGSDPDFAHVGRLGSDLPKDELIDAYAYIRQQFEVPHFDSGRFETNLRQRSSLLSGLTQRQRGAAIAVTPKGRIVTRVADFSREDASWVQWEGLAGLRP